MAITADCHQAVGAWRNRNICGDAYYSLVQLVDYAIDRRLPVIAAGDVLDADDPDPGTMRRTGAAIARLWSARLPFYYTIGNHDRHRTGVPWLSLFDGAVHLDGQSFDVNSWRVHGIDWTPAARLRDRIAAVPEDTRLLILHQVCKEFMDVNHEVVLSEIPGTCMIAVGDYHQTKLVQAGNHVVLSPGSLAIQSIDEEPTKSFSVLYESGRVEHVPLKSRWVGHFEVITQDDLDRFLADRPWTALLGRLDVPEEIRTPLVSVTFAEIPQASVRLTEALANDVHLFLYPLVTRERPQSQPRVVDEIYTLQTAIERSLPGGSPLINPLQRLFAVGAVGAPAELARYKQEFFKDFAAQCRH